MTLSRHPQDFGRHFRLTRDIDLQAVQASLSPIGTPATPFTGSFDGNYHTLKNLKHVDAAAGYAFLRGVRQVPPWVLLAVMTTALLAMFLADPTGPVIGLFLIAALIPLRPPLRTSRPASSDNG